MTQPTDDNNSVAAGHEPTRDEIDAYPGAQVVEFGALWCAHCQRARPFIDAVLAQHPAVRHVRIEDGPGRRLGRSFRVKLWPTLVFLKDGLESERLVRPGDEKAIEAALSRLLAG